MTAPHEPYEGDRMTRLEATADFLVREVGDTKAMSRENTSNINASLEGIREEIRESNRAIRAYFLWTLGIILGALAPTLIGLIVTLLIKL